MSRSSRCTTPGRSGSGATERFRVPTKHLPESRKRFLHLDGPRDPPVYPRPADAHPRILAAPGCPPAAAQVPAVGPLPSPPHAVCGRLKPFPRRPEENLPRSNVGQHYGSVLICMRRACRASLQTLPGPPRIPLPATHSAILDPSAFATSRGRKSFRNMTLSRLDSPRITETSGREISNVSAKSRPVSTFALPSTGDAEIFIFRSYLPYFSSTADFLPPGETRRASSVPPSHSSTKGSATLAQKAACPRSLDLIIARVFFGRSSSVTIFIGEGSLFILDLPDCIVIRVSSFRLIFLI